jgi:carbamoyltransferase
MTQVILGIHYGAHDSGAAVFEDYSIKAAVQLERLTRIKGDGNQPDLAIDEVLGIAGLTRRDVDVVACSRTLFPLRYFRKVRGFDWLRERYRATVRNRPRLTLMHEMLRLKTRRIEDLLDVASYLRDSGFRDGTVAHFYNHHEAHILPALFHSPWDDALLVSADGGGDTVHYSQRYLHAGRLTMIYGGSESDLVPPVEDSVGKLYGYGTKALGFRRVRHEGKITGLSALGRPVLRDRMATRFRVDENGRIYSDFGSDREMVAFVRAIAGTTSREDFAASLQQVLEDIILLSLQRLVARHPSRFLGVSGGVFANVKLNRLLAEELPLDEIFIYPAMGDEGLPVGGVLSYLLARDGLQHWLEQRYDLADLYLGRDFGDDIDRTLKATAGVRVVNESPVDGAAQRLAAGAIGAIFTGRMEYGPRALGARSILANPSRRETHDLLNERLDRSEFMPFAPVIATEKAAKVFGISAVNARACRNMTITCDVMPEWRERIAAVVHVDGSARPQVIERRVNPLYYDILGRFEALTGLPVLVNTSFNVHEEPIVNSPAECVRALVEGRIDFVVTERGLYEYQQ